MALPIPVPTRNVGSLGPVKRDLDPQPRFDTFLGAGEWNLLCELAIRLTTELNNLGLAGTSGTLQAAYNNAQAPGLLPVRVRLDAVRGGVIFTDANPGLSGVLLGVSQDSGANEYGFTAAGLLLADLPGAIRSDVGYAIQMLSRQSLAGGIGYILDTEVQLPGQYFLFKSGGQPQHSLYGNGAFVAWDPSAPLKIFYTLLPTAEGLSLGSTDPNGLNFVPNLPGKGRLGSTTNRWAGLHALFWASSRQIVPFAAAPAIDCRAGAVAEITLTGNLNTFFFTNAEEGLIMTVVLRQDATGGRTLGNIPAGYKLQGGRTLGLSPGANAVDITVWQYTGGEWVEIGRNQQDPPEQRLREQNITNGTRSLVAHLDERIQVFAGALSAFASIDLKHTGAVKGDTFELIFDETAGVQTSVANNLYITENNGAANLATFTEAKTLRGRALCYFTGTAWKLSRGAGLSYL